MKRIGLINPDGTPSEKMALIDDASYVLVKPYLGQWKVSEFDKVYRTEIRGTFGQREKKFELARLVTGAVNKCGIQHVNGNRLDCRVKNIMTQWFPEKKKEKKNEQV